MARLSPLTPILLVCLQPLLSQASSITNATLRMVDGQGVSSSYSVLPDAATSLAEVNPSPSVLPTQSSSGGMDSGAIIGIAITGGVLLILVLILIIYLARHPRLFKPSERLETPHRMDDSATILTARSPTPGDDLFVPPLQTLSASANMRTWDVHYASPSVPPRSRQSMSSKHSYNGDGDHHPLPTLSPTHISPV